MNLKPRDYQEVFNKTKGKCYFCGIDLDKLRFDIDHAIPKSKGGQDTIENLNPTCKPCNASKGALTIEEYMHQLKVRCFNHINKTIHYLNSTHLTVNQAHYLRAHKYISKAWDCIEAINIKFYGDQKNG